MSQQPAAAAAAPAKSKKMLFVIVAAVLVLGGGGGTYWKFFASTPPPGTPEPPKPAKAAGIINFDPFVVNLADEDTQRFLRVTLALAVEGQEAVDEFEEDEPVRMKVRSALLELLTEQRADQLVTPEGKAALKKAIIAGAEHNAEHMKVRDVLFSEFIVQ
jgi:flagellar FliL protein